MVKLRNPKFTKRQQVVVRCLKGHNYCIAAAARELNVSQTTVRDTFFGACRKLGLLGLESVKPLLDWQFAAFI